MTEVSQQAITPPLHPEEALARILSRVQPVSEWETLDLEAALGRVLMQDCCSLADVPPADNSAMDGYALAVDGTLEAGARLPLSQRVVAGVAPQALLAGTAARIFTGGEIPPGANAVAIQEEVAAAGDDIELREAVAAGQWIRPRGQDLQKGQVVVPKGQRLGPVHLGLLASAGWASVPVRRRLRVAVLNTGSELLDPGSELEPGKIYNSNRYLLTGLLNELGVEVAAIASVDDSPEATRACLAKAAEGVDLVISSGGVSVGEEDHVRAAVEALGEVDIWRIAVKPGKPLAFGQICGTAFFGLPGNPVSVFITFLLMVRPWLLAAQGRPQCELPQQLALAEFEHKPSRRQEYLRVRLRQEGHHTYAQAFPRQNSGILSSVAWADALAIVPANTAIQPGDDVAVVSLAALQG